MNARFRQKFSKNYFPSAFLQYLHTRPGLTYQRNVGIKHASGEIIYFFDDDVILDNDYLYEMNRAFDEHSEYGAGMGDISNIRRTTPRTYRLFRSIFLLPRESASGYFTWSGMPTHPYGTKKFKQVEVLGGCCMAFRRDALKNVLFDEKLCGYATMEDCDIARRISCAKPIFFNPRAKLQHLESPAARDGLIERNSMFVFNYSYLFFKNFYTHNRFKIIAYGWSIIGLFLESVIMRDVQRTKGYLIGLKKFIAKE